MYQKCPICNGTGKDPSQFAKVTSPCTVCKGAKIISELTGLPPQEGQPQAYRSPIIVITGKEAFIDTMFKFDDKEESFDPNKPQWKD